MNKFDIIEDRIIIEDNILYENLLNYANPRAINIALNRNFKMFGSIDKMIAKARQNIKQKNVYGLNSREQSLANEIIDKILASMEKNPLLQLFIISLAALGLYKAILVFLRIYSMSIAGLKSIFNAMGTSVKDFFGIQGDHDNREPVKDIIDPRPPKPKVDPIKTSLRKTTVRSPLGATHVDVSPEIRTPETSTQAEPETEYAQQATPMVNKEKITAAVLTGVVTNLLTRQEKAQHDTPVMHFKHNQPVSPDVLNYVKYDQSGSYSHMGTAFMPNGEPFTIKTPLGEVSSIDGVHVIGDKRAMDYASNVIAKTRMRAIHTGGNKKITPFKTIMNTPQTVRKGSKEYLYKQVLDMGNKSASFTIPYDLYMFNNYNDAQNLRVTDKYLKKLYNSPNFKHDYMSYAEKYMFGDNGKYPSSGILLHKGTTVKPVYNFVRQGVLGLRSTKNPLHLYYIPLDMARSVFARDFDTYTQQLPSSKWEESLQYHGEHKTWQYLMLR